MIIIFVRNLLIEWNLKKKCFKLFSKSKKPTQIPTPRIFRVFPGPENDEDGVVCVGEGDVAPVVELDDEVVLRRPAAERHLHHAVHAQLNDPFQPLVPQVLTKLMCGTIKWLSSIKLIVSVC